MQYVLPLTPANTNSTRRMTTLHLMLAFVLCGIGAGCLVLYWFTAVSEKFAHAYRPFAIMGACSMLVGFGVAAIAVFNKQWLMQGRRSFWLRLFEVLMLAGIAATFAVFGQWRPAALFGFIGLAITVAAFWEWRKPVAEEAVIAEAGISLPKGTYNRLIRWSEIESVLLRHSILSIELIGNRLIQRSMRQDATPDTGAVEAFAKKYIQQYEKERAANAAW